MVSTDCHCTLALSLDRARHGADMVLLTLTYKSIYDDAIYRYCVDKNNKKWCKHVATLTSTIDLVIKHQQWLCLQEHQVQDHHRVCIGGQTSD